MHSIWTRLNVFLTLVVTVALVMCCAVAASDAWVDGSGVKAEGGVLGVEKLVKERGGNDEAILNFWVDLDMSEAFSWNTKQLFMYVSVRYTDDDPKNAVQGEGGQGEVEGGEPLVSEVVVWDRIVVPVDAVVKQPRVRNKYKLTGRGSDLIGKPFELVLGWNVMPKCGYMYQRTKVFSSHEWVMPGNYTTDGVAPQWTHGMPSQPRP